MIFFLFPIRVVDERGGVRDGLWFATEYSCIDLLQINKPVRTPSFRLAGCNFM